MKTILSLSLILLSTGPFAFAGTPETREAVACGVAVKAKLFKVQYAYALDDVEIVRPGIDGTELFHVTNIELLRGRKYCIRGNYTVFTFDGPGELESISAKPQ